MGNIKNKRAVSPVIATVILVAVAITIAVAVAYWMGGISSQYTRFEKVEIISAYCASGDTANAWVGDADVTAWNITLNLRNTGTTEATFIGCYVNGKAIADYGISGTGSAPTADNVRGYDVDGAVQLDFAEVGSGTTIKKTVLPGEKGKITVEIKQVPGAPLPYAFSSGTTIEVSLSTGAGNTYMKMVTLS